MNGSNKLDCHYHIAVLPSLQVATVCMNHLQITQCQNSVSLLTIVWLTKVPHIPISKYPCWNGKANEQELRVRYHPNIQGLLLCAGNMPGTIKAFETPTPALLKTTAQRIATANTGIRGLQTL